MTPYLAEALFLAPIIGVAAHHAQRFDRQLPTGKLFHFLWACSFIPVIAALWLLTDHNWLLAGALVLERFIVFSPVLNLLRHPRKPFFYIHKKLQPLDKNGSWQDELIGKAYIPVWVVSVIGLIILQLFI